MMLNDAFRHLELKAFLFDLDGVLTPTVDVHRYAWQLLFEEYLTAQGADNYRGDADYLQFIDGKPRAEGVRDLLASRGLHLPDGKPSDQPADDSVWALGNRKNAYFAAALDHNGMQAYPGSIALLDALRDTDFDVAVVSSSRNAEPVLTAAGIRGRFFVVVDGLMAASENLRGKPSPDTYIVAAQRLGLAPADCIVVEDAQSGVQAGRAGGFGFVVGVDRGAGARPSR
jgi:beta-phosphoglucomutase family hydrolase